MCVSSCFPSDSSVRTPSQPKCTQGFFPRTLTTRMASRNIIKRNFMVNKADQLNLMNYCMPAILSGNQGWPRFVGYSIHTGCCHPSPPPQPIPWAMGMHIVRAANCINMASISLQRWASPLTLQPLPITWNPSVRLRNVRSQLCFPSHTRLRVPDRVNFFLSAFPFPIASIQRPPLIYQHDWWRGMT